MPPLRGWWKSLALRRSEIGRNVSKVNMSRFSDKISASYRRKPVSRVLFLSDSVLDSCFRRNDAGKATNPRSTLSRPYYFEPLAFKARVV